MYSLWHPISNSNIIYGALSLIVIMYYLWHSIPYKCTQKFHRCTHSSHSKPLMHNCSYQNHLCTTCPPRTPTIHRHSSPTNTCRLVAGLVKKWRKTTKQYVEKKKWVFWWTSPSKATCGLKRQVVPGQGSCLCKYEGEGFRDHGTLKRGAPSLQGGLLSECLLDWGHLWYLTGEITKRQ